MRVTIGGYGCRTTVASTDGQFIVPLNAEHRAADEQWVRWIEEAKKADTRTARIADPINALREDRRAR